MNLKHMRELAGELEEHCGCEDDLAEGRAEAENAIWKYFPSDSKAKVGGHRKVMFTGTVAKAAKLPEYTSIKLSDLTDHQIQSVLAVIQKKRESAESSFAALLGEEQIMLLKGLDDETLREALLRIAENMAQSDETPEDVRAVAAEFARVGRATSWTLGEGTLPQKSEPLLRAFLKKHNYELGKGKDCWIEDGDDWHPYGLYAKAAMAAEIADDMNSVGELGKVSLAKVRGDPSLRTFKFEGVGARAESVTDRMRDLLGEAPKKTYKQAQDDILNGLEKDGWKVKRDLKVPHATSPTGDFKLFFKAQAIYKTHGKGDLGNARSLHLPDIRQGDYSTFASALSRWTGRDMKDQPLPKKTEPKFPGQQPGQSGFKFEPQQHHKDLAARQAAAQGKVTGDTKTFINTPGVVTFDPKLNPDQYRAKHGQCPDGYHYDDSTKRCVKSKSEAADKACPKCKGKMLYDDGCDCYECSECSYKGPNSPAEEVLRLAGVNRYPDRQMGRTESGFKGRAREFAGVAGAHDDWRLETPDEDRMDLWHPDKNVKNPGLPMDKPKAAAPADKGSALLKALRCPPGKEAKLVYGKPSCVAKA